MLCKLFSDHKGYSWGLDGSSISGMHKILKFNQIFSASPAAIYNIMLLQPQESNHNKTAEIE